MCIYLCIYVCIYLCMYVSLSVEYSNTIDALEYMLTICNEALRRNEQSG